MDSYIAYSYKDGLHPDVKFNIIEFDKGVYKSYKGLYDTSYDDSITNISRRLWHCHLVSKGNHQCQEFLNDIANYWQNSGDGFVDSYEEVFKTTHEFLKKQELVEISFGLC